EVLVQTRGIVIENLNDSEMMPARVVGFWMRCRTGRGDRQNSAAEIVEFACNAQKSSHMLMAMQNQVESAPAHLTHEQPGIVENHETVLDAVNGLKRRVCNRRRMMVD